MSFLIEGLEIQILFCHHQKKANQLIGWSPIRSDLDNIIKSTWATYNFNMKVNKL